MLNWVKIRVWELEQWDGIIMIDVDVTVLGDLTHLFHLPTDFAAVPDNGKIWNRYAVCVVFTSSSYTSLLSIKIAEGVAHALQVRPVHMLRSAAAASVLCLYHP